MFQFCLESQIRSFAFKILGQESLHQIAIKDSGHKENFVFKNMQGLLSFQIKQYAPSKLTKEKPTYS